MHSRALPAGDGHYSPRASVLPPALAVDAAGSATSVVIACTVSSSLPSLALAARCQLPRRTEQNRTERVFVFVVLRAGTTCSQNPVNPADMESSAFIPATAATAATSGAAASAAAPSSVSVVEGWLVGGSSSLRSFSTAVYQSGLGIVQSADYDAPTLYRIACEAVSREELASTGYLLIQAVALVQCWVLTNKREPLQHGPEVVQFGESIVQWQTRCCSVAVALCLRLYLTSS